MIFTEIIISYKIPLFHKMRFCLSELGKIHGLFAYFSVFHKVFVVDVNFFFVSEDAGDNVSGEIVDGFGIGADVAVKKNFGSGNVLAEDKALFYDLLIDGGTAEFGVSLAEICKLVKFILAGNGLHSGNFVSVGNVCNVHCVADCFVIFFYEYADVGAFLINCVAEFFKAVSGFDDPAKNRNDSCDYGCDDDVSGDVFHDFFSF